MSELFHEIRRRRTFAIISHPDAGKTTLTEKLLLYGGSVEVAGAVRARKSQRAATSDWMELEKQRGISVSSTVLPFEYEGYHVNLLDTPGHHDFSEDTYRTLTAADCAVMVIDLAKGVEEQTEKLFRVCALRKIPVITFVNKVDRAGIDPLKLLGDIEAKLGIVTAPRNWPIGTGTDFCGVVDLESRRAEFFDEKDSFRRIAARSIPLEELSAENIRAPVVTAVTEEVELLRAEGHVFDRELFLAGEVTPVYFGSALTNYGVAHFLNAFLELCPSPSARASDRGVVAAEGPEFSGFVFKIQANLDPQHRDRIAFVRICSGKFCRDMDVRHPRTGKTIRLRRAHRIFGRERETVDEAYAGDIIGLVNPGEFHLGDTICTGPPLNLDSLPQFSPEFFAVVRNSDTTRRKQFERGLEQLIEEGAIQKFTDPSAVRSDPLLAAVGQLQFDVVRFRLETEYNTKTQLDWLPYKLARWITSSNVPLSRIKLPANAKVVRDQHGYDAVLFQSAWDAKYYQRENPEVVFSAVRMGTNSGPEQNPIG
jgi:peptide chain release factor 3